MPGLRETLDAATPAPWLHSTGPDDDWGFVALGESGGHGTYGFEASHDIPQAINDARLIVLAPELAALVLEMGEALTTLNTMAAHSDSATGFLIESGIELNALLARLDRIGKEQT